MPPCQARAAVLLPPACMAAAGASSPPCVPLTTTPGLPTLPAAGPCLPACLPACLPGAASGHSVAKEQYCDPVQYYDAPHAACFRKVRHHYFSDAHDLRFGPDEVADA